jgi:hypothetical protein
MSTVALRIFLGARHREAPLGAQADEQVNFVSNIPSMHGGWGNSFD